MIVKKQECINFQAFSQMSCLALYMEGINQVKT